MNQVIASKDAPAALGPYSQAVMAGDTLYLSGQLGLDPATGKLADGVAGQAGQALRNIKAVLAETGMTDANLVKTTIFLKDIADFKAVNEVYAAFFTDSFPARSCVAVADLPAGGLVEIEGIAVR